MYSYRNATEDDRDLVVQLYLSDVEENTKSASEFANDLIERLKTILCSADGKIVGTISWDTRGGLDDGVIELVGLGVSEEHRRKGVADELVQRLLKDASVFYAQNGHSLRVVYLFMEKGNEHGSAFYNHFGFKEVAVVPALMPDGDATIWTLHV